MTTPHITTEILSACAGASNPRTIRRRLRDAGHDEATAGILAGQVAAALALRVARRDTRPGLDPLIRAQWTRERKMVEIKRLRPIRAAAMYAAWHATFRERVELSARVGGTVEHEARLATIEAITRAARNRGWTVRHSSTARDGRVSSRYIRVPGLGEVRLSDHDLPETAERAWKREQGCGGGWTGEVVVYGDWRTVRLDTWLRRVILAAAGRY